MQLCQLAGCRIQTLSTFRKLQVENSEILSLSNLIKKIYISGTYNYGTYPGAYGQQIQQGGYPHPQQYQQDPNKPYGF
jgi:hypothetical protein